LPPPHTNLPPTVTIVAPQDGATFFSGANIRICADADDVDGFVTSVEFFENGNSLGVVTNYPIFLADTPINGFPPYHSLCLVWSNAPPGDYSLTAVATDNGGATGTSGPVSITVLTNLPPPQTNIPPTVTIVAPQEGATFYSGANVRICADADDVDGFVTSVEFFENGTSLGVVTNPPILYSGISDIFEPLDRLFCLTWSNAPPGAYALTAVATDNGGAMATSAPVNIMVTTNLPPPPTNIPPHVEIVHPTNGSTFYSNANVEICASAWDPDGFVKTVEFFENGASLGVVTNYPFEIPLYGGLEFPIPIFHSLCLTWSNAPPGAYALTAVATDNGGATGTSAPVSITVLTTSPPPPTNIPPVVKIESPMNGATFDATVNIRLEAEAHDDDGSVKSVEFFAGGTSLGVSSNYVILDPLWFPITNDMEFPIQVFFLTWSNAVAGSYDLTAVATDNGGATGTSGPVSITVLTNLPPPPTNIPPHVEIVTPLNGASFFAFANISIAASAHDLDGYVSTVEFFENGTSLGIRTNNPMAANPVNPFQLVWSNAPPGNYTLTAIATD
ncbi:MAG TPA: Ig-like domain-containing protein, partial [Verrucomicrobiae bacterium]|nr:Ig-like domain-containing protein [Verrucomicrobiae bacterium]